MGFRADAERVMFEACFLAFGFCGFLGVSALQVEGFQVLVISGLGLFDI